MRSLLSPAPEAAPAARPATEKPSTEAAAPTAPPRPGAAPLQARLYETTERLAVALIERAEKDLLEPAADGKGPSIHELKAVVEFSMNLLVKLPKLKPDEEEDDAGVAVLAAAMSDPGQIVHRLQANPKFIAALRAIGWLPPPERPHHRPTKVQAAAREEYDARQSDLAEADDDDEDSALRGMLKGKVQ